MSINWHRLRSWDGSQDQAFEELCCQLASCEKTPPGSHFIRKRAPDAGVECYWKLATGEEWGWQAKFFTSVPTTQQWQQIDESVQTALDKHPSLVLYTICIPLDRQDPRQVEQEWFMDKWNVHVTKWKQAALKNKRSIDFEYWGEHEIFSRLSKSEHAGRLYFWFNEEYLGQGWFNTCLEKTIANAGPRYSPEVNVELPISLDFDGLGRTSEFYSRLTAHIAAIRKHWKSVTGNISETTKSIYSSLESTMSQLCSLLSALPSSSMNQLDFERMAGLCSQAGKDTWTCLDELRRVHKEEEKREQESKKVGTKSNFSLQERHDLSYHLLNRLVQSLNELRTFAVSNEALLANKPYLLLVGKAGTGKTHLFCDVAKRRNERTLPTVVLLGEQFIDSEPWQQIIKLLGLSCQNEEELLGALEATAQSYGTRALLLIDALNEGEGKRLWHKYIAGMIRTLSRFPYVGLAVSVRTSFERIVVPEQVNAAQFVREVHEGFADHEYDATATFFDHYQIQRPAVPLLVPEFRNPLFLKIFCKGLQNRGLTTIPDGLDGISAVFEFFVDSINEKLSRPGQLDFDVKGKFVQKAVIALAEKMAQSEASYLKRDDARTIVESVLHTQGYTKSLFNGLISEGLLAEDIVYLGKHSTTEDVVRFAYERFGDHLIANFLLEKYLDTTNPASSFSCGQCLHEFVKDDASAWGARGLIEAFSVQLPEKINKELIEVAPFAETLQPVQEAFLDSLLWRRANNIGKAALQYVNNTIIRSSYFHDRFLDTLLTLAPKPDHPFNAKFLHRNLKSQDLAKRDAWWSIFLHRHYGSNGAVDRLLDWAWSQHARHYIKDDALYLLGISLGWFLTSSNRFIRDRATKGLVTLFEDRLQLLKTILQDFQDVNDPYIQERLLAVAYGCAMRSRDDGRIAELATLLYEQLFLGDNPPPHILLRDYARGVIEVALNKGLSIKIDVKKIRPPYKSEWIPPSSTTDELRYKYYPKDWKTDRSYGDIWGSVMSEGDFARYIIGTNSHRFDWTNRKLGERRKPSRKELYQKFEKSLVGEKKKALANYVGARNTLDLYRRMGKHLTPELSMYSEQDLEAIVTFTEGNLRKILSKAELKRLDGVVLPYLRNPYVDEFAFDLSIAQRWIFERVIKFGWTPELFGEFDRSIREGMRDTNKPERIGKKYQWIAYHEFLARIADNFEYRGDTWAKVPQRYVGPWQDFLRDIDPSFILPRTENDSWDQKPCWWFPVSYDWQDTVDDATWLRRSEDLPSIESLIKIGNPKDPTKWLLLEGFLNLKQPSTPNHDENEGPRRDWFFILKSYLVRKRDMKIVFEWVKKQNFIGRWMPESTEMSKVFAGEYPWAPSVQYLDIPYFGHPGWTKGWRGEKIPRPILITNDEYFWERGYDCSIRDTVRFNLPAKLIVDQMRLHWNGFPGTYLDASGNVVFFDPSVKERGPSVLLTKEDSFLSFLSEHGYEILWTVLAEKNMIGGTLTHEDWKGRLEISGAYCMLSGKLTGSLNASFHSPETRK